MISLISVFFAPLESFWEEEGAEQEELISLTSIANDTRAIKIDYEVNIYNLCIAQLVEKFNEKRLYF